MKRLIAAVSASMLLVGMLFSAQAFAFDPLTDTGACPAGSNASVCQDNASSTTQTVSDNKFYGPNGALTKVVNILSYIVGAVAVIIIIIAGLSLITSTGDQARLTSARNSIIYAIVGLAIVAFSQAIIVFVLRRL